MKIKTFYEGEIQCKIYININNVEQTWLIAIPEYFWSVELPLAMEINELNESLIMHLFTLKNENEAMELANLITTSCKEYIEEMNK